MSILDVAKELLGFEGKTWSLVSEDSPIFVGEMRGQFVAQNLEQTVGSFLGETSTINQAQPDFQWQGL